MMAAGGSRLAVVVPPGSFHMNRSLSFRMLRRWADDANCHVLIVSRDPPVKRIARDFGFPTTSSLRSAEGYWRHSDTIASASPAKAWVLRHAGGIVGRLAGLFVLVLIVGVVSYLALPVATVRLSAPAFPVSQRMEIVADPAVTSVDLAGKRIPARVIRAVVDGSDRLPTTGKKETKVAGFVIFGNLTDQQVDLPAGTVVSTLDGRRFATKNATLVPAPRFTSVRAEVEALEPGKKGEAERLAISRVEGRHAQAVAVLNEQPLMLDKSFSDAQVAPEDKERLRASLYDRLNKQAVASLNQQTRQYEVLALQSIEVEITQEDYDHNVGDDSTTLTLRLGLRATATVMDQRQATDVARTAQEAGLPAGQRLLADSLKIGPLEVISTSGGAVRFATKVEGLATQPYDEGVIRSLVAGVPAAQAALALQKELKLERLPEIRVEPDWSGKAYRVQVVVEGKR